MSIKQEVLFYSIIFAGFGICCRVCAHRVMSFIARLLVFTGSVICCRVFDPSSPPGSTGSQGTQHTDTFIGLILGNLLHEQGNLSGVLKKL